MATADPEVHRRMLNVDFKSPKLWAQAGVVFLLVTFIALDIDHYVEDSSTPRLTWTRKAALEAETVAAIDCSNHGRAYTDGNTVNGVQVCECHNCYSGPTCAVYNQSCVADATVGDALFLRKYWMHERQNIAVLISGWHRMSYFIGKNFMSEELERNIRLLHKKVGNANVTDEHKIVFGNGITQLLNGVIISLSPDLNANPNATVMNVVAAAPYYPVFKSQTTFFNHTGYRWKGNALDYVNTTNPQDFIEIVTSPNNPDGYLRKSVIPGSIAVYDHATYWPHYAPIVEESDEDIMLFTLGKYTGHAGSRFGWAILKNQDVYDKLTKYVATNSEGVSRETQFRTLKIVKDILEEKELHHEDFNEFGYKVLRERWVKVTTLVSFSDRFSVQEMSSEYCNYFKRIREPATAYAWLRCNWEDEEDCAAVLETGKIKANSGVHYEASSRFVRVSLVKTDDDFDQLMERLTALVHTPPADRNISLYHSIINQESSTRRPFIPDSDY